MIRTLKTWGARGLFPLVPAAGMGFGVLAAATGMVIGGLLVLGARLAEAAGPSGRPPTPAATTADGAPPA